MWPNRRFLFEKGSFGGMAAPITVIVEDVELEAHVHEDRQLVAAEEDDALPKGSSLGNQLLLVIILVSECNIALFFGAALQVDVTRLWCVMEHMLPDIFGALCKS